MARFALLLLPALLLPGCIERRLQITSDPPGALIWVNDVELGRTPVEADFTFYGDYDVRVRLDGYEPIQQIMTASEPVYEYPPFDLVAMAIPAHFDNVVKWHFDLRPALEKSETPDDFKQSLIDRAHATRDKLGEPPASPDAKPPEAKPQPIDSKSPDANPAEHPKPSDQAQPADQTRPSDQAQPSDQPKPTPQR